MTHDNIKSHKKPGFHNLFRRYCFWKTTGGVKLIPPAVLRLRECHEFTEIVFKVTDFTIQWRIALIPPYLFARQTNTMRFNLVDGGSSYWNYLVSKTTMAYKYTLTKPKESNKFGQGQGKMIFDSA